MFEYNNPLFILFCMFISLIIANNLVSDQELFDFLHKLFSSQKTLSETTEDSKEILQIIPYENKYKKEYQKRKEEYQKRKEADNSEELTEEKKKSLKNSLLFENTPLGNVMMFYDDSRETFTYYSDSTIPYRYLETISRKYVIMYHCASLYIDMEDEIKEAERKRDLEKEKEEKDKRERNERQDKGGEEKKSVFAKLKKYNRSDAKSQIIQPGSSNKTTNNSRMNGPDKTAENKNMIVKENANRYSYEGKLVNFSFLKKVDRKLLDSKYAMSFSDFKKKMEKNKLML